MFNPAKGIQLELDSPRFLGGENSSKLYAFNSNSAIMRFALFQMFK
jgi:hypothetical protein